MSPAEWHHAKGDVIVANVGAMVAFQIKHEGKVDEDDIALFSPVMARKIAIDLFNAAFVAEQEKRKTA